MLCDLRVVMDSWVDLQLPAEFFIGYVDKCKWSVNNDSKHNFKNETPDSALSVFQQPGDV